MHILIWFYYFSIHFIVLKILFGKTFLTQTTAYHLSFFHTAKKLCKILHFYCKFLTQLSVKNEQSQYV
jgi:hypothetical protein